LKNGQVDIQGSLELTTNMVESIMFIKLDVRNDKQTQIVEEGFYNDKLDILP